VALDARGNIERDRDYMSSVPGVFVAGTPARPVADRVGDREGARAAAAWTLPVGLDTAAVPIPPTARPLTV
jgi:glutamate synthase (NADPH/NADH) small chain